MIATIGRDTIKTLANGEYRAHRMATFWVGDYTSYADAARALQIANSPGRDARQAGKYDGGVYATEDQHFAAVDTIFGPENCVTEDDVRRTILAGEAFRLQGGFPVRP